MLNEYMRGLPTRQINGKFLKNWADVSDFYTNAVLAATDDVRKSDIPIGNNNRGRFIQIMGVSAFTVTPMSNAVQIWIDGARARIAGITAGQGPIPVSMFVPPLAQISIYYFCNNTGAAAHNFRCYCVIDEFDSKGMGTGTRTANPAAGAVAW